MSRRRALRPPVSRRERLIWLRRLLAGACLALAAVSALPHPPPTSAAGPTVPPGRVQVPVLVGGADPHAYLRPGSVVELLAGTDPAGVGQPPPSAAVLAQGAVVISIAGSNAVGAEDSWQLVVAVSEADARRIAARADRVLVAVAGRKP